MLKIVEMGYYRPCILVAKCISITKFDFSDICHVIGKPPLLQVNVFFRSDVINYIGI